MQGQQVGRQALLFDFAGEEVQQVAGNATGVFVRVAETGVAVRRVGFHYRNHFLRRAHQVLLTKALVRFGDRDRLAARRQGGAVIDVVHAFQAGTLAVVHFEDDLVGLVNPGFVVADGRRRNQPTIFRNAYHLDDGNIQLAEETGPGVLGHVRQVDIHVFHLAFVDLLAAGGIALVGQAHFNAVYFGQRAVQFRGGGGTGPYADAEVLATGAVVTDVLGQGLGHGFRVARAGKAAHAYVHAGGDQAGSVSGTHNTFAKFWATNPGFGRHDPPLVMRLTAPVFGLVGHGANRKAPYSNSETRKHA